MEIVFSVAAPLLLPLLLTQMQKNRLASGGASWEYARASPKVWPGAILEPTTRSARLDDASAELCRRATLFRDNSHHNS